MHVHPPPPPTWKKSSAQKCTQEETKFRPDMSAKKNVHVSLTYNKITTKVLETNKRVMLAFIFVFIVYRTVSYIFERLFSPSGTHAKGRNIVGQQHATLLGPTCFIRLHRTTTMLALVGTRCIEFETGQTFGPSKLTQHCWPKTPNNTQQCCDWLRPFARALSVYTNKAISSDRLYL